MRSLRRVLGLTGMTGLLAALVAAVPAAAQEPGAEAACTVSGLATTSGVNLGANTGTYTFDSAGDQTGLELNCNIETTDGDMSVSTVSVTSEGTFDNEVCGTGVAESEDGADTDTLSNDITGVNRLSGDNTDAFILAQEDDLDYVIDFTATVGDLVFQSDDDNNDGVPDNPNNASGGGPIEITDPTPGRIGPGEDPTSTTLCTNDFQVTGALDGMVPPEA